MNGRRFPSMADPLTDPPQPFAGTTLAASRDGMVMR
jgi:hypothetical protein